MSVEPRHLPPGNLPTRSTRFIGHAEEVMRLADAIDDNPVVTVTGAGGIGKTRTAIEFAKRFADFFPDGVRFVNFTLLDDGADVVPFVCETLRDIAPLARDARSIASALNDRRILLLFDSCEHVLAQTAELAAIVAEGAPSVRILATSRQPLGIEAEVTHRLGTLSLEDAIELFADRASNAGILVDNGLREIAASIVVRLDAIPLAIELAAPQLRAMPPEELLRHLDGRLELLSMENSGAPSRQQTLEAMHEWSHRLIGENARKLFRRLAIFVGGWTLEAAMHVCVDPDFNEARLSEALDELMTKSLVVSENVDGRMRYRMLEITRMYAQSRLFESKEYDEAAQSHVHFFVLLAKRFETMLEAMPVAKWQNMVMVEAQNFRAALSLALDAGDVESAATICEAGHYWLWEHGSVHASDLTGRIAAMLDTSMDAAPEAPLQLAYAALLRRSNRHRALDAAKRAYELYRELGDDLHLADALRCTGSLQHDVLGAPSPTLAGEMERYADTMLEMASSLRAAELLNNLGVSYAQLLDDARLQDSLVCFERAASLLEARGDRERAGRVIGNSAATAYLLGDAELAVRWGRRAVDLFDPDVETIGAGHQWSNYGFYLAAVGRFGEARTALQRGIEIARNLGDRVGLSGVLEYAAHYYHLLENDRFAARMIGCADALLPADIASQARAAAVMQELFDALRATLGDEGFEAERQLGASMPPDLIVREAQIV